jgi:GH15 family glucan-1,4-alpha-glucosidase
MPVTNPAPDYARCRIEDFALIGDCETAALVGRDGSIDWLCWPRFDSDACFAALLGTPEHGRWKLAPTDPNVRVTRRYRPNTLILETRYETDTGTATLIDFMPPRGSHSDVVRLLVGERGEVGFRMELTLRFGYGRIVPWVTRLDDGALRAIAGPDMVVLRTPAGFRGEDYATVADVTVTAGESVPFVLTYALSHEPIPDPIDVGQALADTEAFWTEWAARFRPAAMDGHVEMPAHWRAAVIRSLITLKALTYAPTGGIVAAATTSLPEKIGGERNWDYRFCWLRDASITLFALMNGGYFDEARAWRDWLLRAIAGSTDQLQIMYGVAGERRLMEWEIEWLPGFAGSKPVRVGNGAHGQLQLDVYGEVMSLLHRARLGGLPESDAAWALQRDLLKRLEAIWADPDAGIWEIRGEPRHFTFSKVMAWVAFDRCIKSAEQFHLDDAPLERWRELRDRIHAEVCERGWNEARGCFTQAYGWDELDASLLLLPLFEFLPASDPRMRATIEAVERELLVDGFVKRYRTSPGLDGLPSGEGAFLACSFWLVECLALLGRYDDAVAMFERLLALQNDVGLLAEEYDPLAARQLGNVPQAFSHVALVTTAMRLAEALQRRGQPGTAASSVPVPA